MIMILMNAVGTGVSACFIHSKDKPPFSKFIAANLLGLNAAALIIGIIEYCVNA